MKPSLLRPMTLLCGALAAGGAATAVAATANRPSSPIIITRPAIPDGSVGSLAPFLAARPFDDVKRPDGIAIDNTIPPNTPATHPEPLPAPAPIIAVFAPASPTGVLAPTGPAAAGVSAPLDAARIIPTVQASDFGAGEQVVNDIEVRVRESQTALAFMRRTVDEMSPAGRDQFHAANAEVKQAEAALRRSIRQARNADELSWQTARAQLAADYSALASALGRIDAAAGITPPPVPAL